MYGNVSGFVDVLLCMAMYHCVYTQLCCVYGNVSGFVDVPLCMAMYQVPLSETNTEVEKNGK